MWRYANRPASPPHERRGRRSSLPPPASHPGAGPGLERRGLHRLVTRQSLARSQAQARASLRGFPWPLILGGSRWPRRRHIGKCAGPSGSRRSMIASFHRGASFAGGAAPAQLPIRLMQSLACAGAVVPRWRADEGRRNRRHVRHAGLSRPVGAINLAAARHRPAAGGAYGDRRDRGADSSRTAQHAARHRPHRHLLAGRCFVRAPVATAWNSAAASQAGLASI